VKPALVVLAMYADAVITYVTRILTGALWLLLIAAGGVGLATGMLLLFALPADLVLGYRMPDEVFVPIGVGGAIWALAHFVSSPKLCTLLAGGEGRDG
jgi:hypothetical protein